MALSPKLEFRQTQSLVMTPQLQQAIKLLQLTNLELAEFVAQELERNPLLEREEAEPAGEDESRTADTEGDAGDAAEAEGAPGPGEEGDASDGAGLADDPAPDPDATPFDADYDNDYTNDSGADDAAPTPPEPFSVESFAGTGGRGATDFSDPDLNLENTLGARPTLRDHLLEQLQLDIAEPGDRLIGQYLVDSIDEAGYLTAEPEAVARLFGCERARVEAVLARLQRFDPPGIFARSLAECLALQLKERNRLDPAMQALLDNLPLVARRDVAALTRLCAVDAADVLDMIAEIRSLDPKPAHGFEGPLAAPVIPDVLMRAQPDGSWLIELNPETLPRVLVNTRYYAQISKRVRSKGDKQYLTEQFHSANWLVKALHQRATTILKVAGEIVRQQDAFFGKGVSHLKPLVLRDIAGVIEMHESTVSRVTSNKYIATPRGIFELKYFFTTAIGSSDGGTAHSAEAVRHRIKALTEAESADGVLSDDRIVEILRAEGIDIARRTVAKYRESLRIPSSVQRRREKGLKP
ncbi:MAG: RNA polymerase factor sigma-54 [Proteobacteria bacterium]|nr:RNA polymerase factor sigma-54 [Pseudomonadota bacterium]